MCMGIQLVLRHVVHHLLLLLLLMMMITVRLCTDLLALLVRVHVLCLLGLLSPVALLLLLLQVLPWLISLWGSHKVRTWVPRISSICMQHRFCA